MTINENLPREFPNDTKLRELILHIASKSQDDRPFGATKLNKLLFFADFLHYLKHGRSITGHEYQRLDHGPAPRRIKPLIREMEARGEVDEHVTEFFGKSQKKLCPKRSAELESFSATEIALVDGLISDAWGRTAKEISELSHDFIGWKLANNGDTIPYEVALVGDRRPSAAEIEEGHRLQGRATRCLSV